jgi:hypothetical protein
MTCRVWDMLMKGVLWMRQVLEARQAVEGAERAVAADDERSPEAQQALREG